MKNIIKVSLITFGVIMISFFLLYFSGLNDTPKNEEKTVLDIRNKSDQTISRMYLSVVIPDSFVIPDGSIYEDGDLVIPDIKPYERIIVVLKHKAIAVGGMKLRLIYNDYNDIIVDELLTNERLGSIGSTHIVEINASGNIRSKEVHNYFLQKNDVFYYKRYSRIIDLN